MFKHTGIVRRIDEAGRIAIPKEVRRKYRIHDGDPIEIGEGENTIMLKKYSVLELFNETTHKIIMSFSQIMRMPIIMCNTTHVLCSARTVINKNETQLTLELSNCLADESCSCCELPILRNSELKVKALERIYINGCLEGALIIPDSEMNVFESHCDALELCAGAIAAIAE